MNKKMISRLQEMGLDPNQPISKHDLLQLEGNRNINPVSANTEAVVVEVELPENLQLEDRIENSGNDNLSTMAEAPNPEPSGLSNKKSPEKDAEPKKPKNALKEIPKPASKPTSSRGVRKKKEPS